MLAPGGAFIVSRVIDYKQAMDAWILVTIITLAAGEERTHLENGGTRAHCEMLAAELTLAPLIRAYCDRARLPAPPGLEGPLGCAACGATPGRAPA